MSNRAPEWVYSAGALLVALCVQIHFDAAAIVLAFGWLRLAIIELRPSDLPTPPVQEQPTEKEKP